MMFDDKFEFDFARESLAIIVRELAALSEAHQYSLTAHSNPTGYGGYYSAGWSLSLREDMGGEFLLREFCVNYWQRVDIAQPCDVVLSFKREIFPLGGLSRYKRVVDKKILFANATSETIRKCWREMEAAVLDTRGDRE